MHTDREPSANPRRAARMGRRALPWILAGLAFAAAACDGGKGPGAPAPGARPDVEAFASLLDQGVSAIEQYDYLRAYGKFTGAIAILPGSDVAHFDAGLAAMNLQKIEDEKTHVTTDYFPIAEKEFREAIRLNPKNLHARFSLGILLKHLSRNDEALTLFEGVTAADPKDPYVLYEYGAMLVAKDRVPEGLKAIEEAVRLQPAFASAIYQLAMIVKRTDPVEGKKLLEAFQALDPNPDPARRGDENKQSIKTGEIYGEDGKYASAIRRFSATGDPGAAIGAKPPAAGPADAPPAAIASLGGPFPALQRPDGTPAPPAFALGDLDGDGILDLVLCGQPRSGGAAGTLAQVWKGTGDGSTFARASDLEADGIACALGDLDGDGDLDLIIAGDGSLAILENDGKGSFVPSKAKLPAAKPGFPVAVLAFDADADWDVDIAVVRQVKEGGAVTASVELLNNNRDGSFRDIAPAVGFDRLPFVPSGALFADLDGDIDADILVLARPAEGSTVLLNDRAWRYRKVPAAEMGGVGALIRQAALPAALEGPLVSAILAKEPRPVESLAFLMDSGGRPLLLRARPGGPLEVVVLGPPPRSWIAIDLSGPGPGHPAAKEPKVKITWSNPIGVGSTVEVTWGMNSEVQQMTGTGVGGACGPFRLFFDLDGAQKADYVRILWPDGVLQSEADQPAGKVTRVAEIQRKPTSCPIVFAWDGTRFRFVGDFLGVGGLGYLEAPGSFSKPDPTEVLELPALVATRAPDGSEELRLSVLEPQEECTYLDALELVAADAPEGVTVHPDEIFPVRAPAPGAVLLAYREALPAARAEDEAGRDVTAELRAIDRTYAGARILDRRFPGVAEPHSIVLSWDRDLPAGPGAAGSAAPRPVLFLHGYVEYGFSTSNFAAAQAGLVLRAPSVLAERGGRWETLRGDWGFPGGTPRWMAVDLGGTLRAGDRRLRVDSNLEIYWDQAFAAEATPVPLGEIGRHAEGGAMERSARKGETAGVRWTALAADRAELRFRGFPRDRSPDGKKPAIYDYDDITPRQVMKPFPGRYTPYGEAKDLVRDADDTFAILGEGDEVLLSFRADRLPPLPAGHRRTFFLAGVGYCKDMDLYTAASDRIEPLPFRAMSAYPPPAGESGGAPAGESGGPPASQREARAVEPLRLGSPR